MKHFLFLLSAFLCCAYPSFAQISVLKAPGDRILFSNENQALRPDPAGGGSLAETLDRTFDSIAQRTTIRGFNAALRLPDGSYWKRAKGRAAILPGVTPLTPQHLMGMGSITKSFVSVALLRMQEAGLLDLDDSIGQYLPVYPNISGKATVRQLLSHRTGFNDYINENPATSQVLLQHLDSIWVTDTVLNHFVLAPNFALDAKWSYSNTNFLLAGRVIEVVSGKPWYQVVRELVLNPLGLTHTFAYPWETPGNQPFAHMFVEIDPFPGTDDWQGLGLSDAGLFSMAGSAGCLISNPEDLVHFSEQVYGGHFLQAGSLAEMQTDYIRDGSGVRYGLGAISFPTINNWGHDGDLIYKSLALYFPDLNAALAVQQNDERNHDPADAASPKYDVYGMFEALLYAFITYSPMSAAPDLHQPALRLVAAPNPMQDAFRLQFSGEVPAVFPLPIALMDINGRQVHSQILSEPTTEIYIGTLPAGVYILKAGGQTIRVTKL